VSYRYSFEDLLALLHGRAPAKVDAVALHRRRVEYGHLNRYSGDDSQSGRGTQANTYSDRTRSQVEYRRRFPRAASQPQQDACAGRQPISPSFNRGVHMKRSI
jgi:hypothetical protein